MHLARVWRERTGWVSRIDCRKRAVYEPRAYQKWYRYQGVPYILQLIHLLELSYTCFKIIWLAKFNGLMTCLIYVDLPDYVARRRILPLDSMTISLSFSGI